MKQMLNKMKSKFGLFIIVALLLTACSSTFDNLVENANVEMGKGNFTEAYELYKEALEEKDDPSIANIVKNIEKYMKLLEAMDTETWGDALDLGKEIADDEEAPYALKKEVRDLLSKIEEQYELSQNITEQIAKIEKLIKEEKVDEAKSMLADLEAEVSTEKQRDKLSSIKEKIADIERKIEEEKERQLAEEKKKQEERERKEEERKQNMSSLKTSYLQKVDEVRDEIAYMERTEDPISTPEYRAYYGRIFMLWDDLINDLWSTLEKEMPKGEFEVLRQDQLKWIQEKEAMADEIMEMSGTLGPAEASISNSNYTEERILYLIENYMK